MGNLLKRCLPFGLVGVVSVWIAFSNASTGDYPADAGPAVHALAHGQISTYFSIPAMMGPFSTLVQAPFAALAGSGELAEYRWASLPCLLAAGLLGLYLAGFARRRGASNFTQALIAGLCLVNPLTFEALRMGHPEEILTAALAVAAVASAAEGRRWRAAVLLGLAVASKQWAVIAILPVLMALPARRVQAGLVAAVVAFLLVLPGFLAAPDAFKEVHDNAASTGRVVTPWSVWYPAAGVVTEHYTVDSMRLTARVHEAPPLVGSLSHPLIVLLAIGLPLALAACRQRFRLDGADAMGLLALLALLRCVLDPVDNLYYHLPFLLALLGWDAFAAKGLPVRGLLGAGFALLFWRWSQSLTDVYAFNAAYLAVTLTATVAITWALLRRSPQRAGPARGRTFVWLEMDSVGKLRNFEESVRRLFVGAMRKVGLRLNQGLKG
ncbi:MAG TPA: glycosyltransferase 87 family protein [Solirubrobacterales bacterium]